MSIAKDREEYCIEVRQLKKTVWATVRERTHHLVGIDGAVVKQVCRGVCKQSASVSES